MVDAVPGSATPAAATPAAVGVNAGSPPASNGAAAPGGSGNGATVDPFSGLDTGSREWVGKSGAKDVATLVKNAIHAESLIGKSVQLPAADAKPEELDKFFGKLGRPEKADGYEFALPAGVPEGMPYDGEFAKEFKTAAHVAGLTPKQATAAHDFYVGKMADQFKADHQKTADRMNTATETLEKQWGPKTGELFKKNSDLAYRTVKNGGLEKAFQSAGLLGPDNLVVDPVIAQFLVKAFDVFKEGEAPSGGQAAGIENPFKDGPATLASPGNPAKGNLTEQMAVIKKDRAGAARQMRAAGRKPSEWGLPDTE